jgi:murein DD-endopeptidase MepM/ murein hydrolase activator NlpD
MPQFKLFYPLKPFVVSQRFGENLVDYKALLGLKGHPGWDMVGTWGQVIHAAHDGVVQSVEQDGRGGLFTRTKKETGLQ